MRITSALVTLLAPLQCVASCLVEFPTLAKVEVTACQSIELGASPSKTTRTARLGVFPHKQGAIVSGTLLSVEVLDSKSVSREPDTTGEATNLPLGTAYFFVRAEAANTCPKILPQKMSLIIEGTCCDKMPFAGTCMSPFPEAAIESKPNRWHGVISGSGG